MSDKTLTVTATEFKARRLKIMDDLETGRIDEVTITRRGKAAVVSAPALDEFRPLHGAHRGDIWIDPSVDLTQPIAPIEDWNIEKSNLP
jgi:hypothetical protein